MEKEKYIIENLLEEIKQYSLDKADLLAQAQILYKEKIELEEEVKKLKEELQKNTDKNKAKKEA